jgi:predicted nucleic acid-binding protein
MHMHMPMHMPMPLVLDSGGLSALAGRSGRERARALRARGLWPPTVPTIVCVEALTGHGSRDALTHRLLGACEVLEHLDLRTARQAASLRHAAGTGTAVDALVVAVASRQQAAVLTGDPRDITALAEYAPGVAVVRA